MHLFCLLFCIYIIPFLPKLVEHFLETNRRLPYYYPTISYLLSKYFLEISHISTSMISQEPSSTTSIQLSYLEQRATTPIATESNDIPTTKMPSWSQAEVESSQSAQRPIPPGEQTKVFSWADVKDIVGRSQPLFFLIPLSTRRFPKHPPIEIKGKTSLPCMNNDKTTARAAISHQNDRKNKLKQ